MLDKIKKNASWGNLGNKICCCNWYSLTLRMKGAYHPTFVL